MQLCSTTLTILKNFSQINSSLWVPEGNCLRTLSVSKGCLGQAYIPEEFDREFGIYNLNQFLGILSVHESPNLEFGDDFVTIADESGDAVTKFYYSGSDTVRKPAIGDLTLDDNDPQHTSFLLSSNDYKRLIRSASILQNPEVAFRSRAGKVDVAAVNTIYPSSNEFSLNVEGRNIREFDIRVRFDNFKFLDIDYQVVISPKRIVEFRGDHDGTSVAYWVPGIDDSTHEDHEG